MNFELFKEESVPENRVVAEVDDKKIYDSDVQGLMRAMGSQGAAFASESGVKQLTDELINQELLYLQAKEDHLDEDQEFKDRLAIAEKQILQQYALGKLLSQVEVSDSEVEEDYNKHKDEAKPLYLFNADHILLDSEEEAKEVKKALDEGASFEKLAKEKSTCPSGKNGGSLGDFGTGQMVEPFEKAILEMEVGSISDPVKSEFGWHVIRLNSRKKKRGTSLNEMREEIRHRLTLMKQQKVYLDKLKKIEKKHDVKRHLD